MLLNMILERTPIDTLPDFNLLTVNLRGHAHFCLLLVSFFGSVTIMLGLFSQLYKHQSYFKIAYYDILDLKLSTNVCLQAVLFNCALLK